jgi:enamine deaminase RidA (YjgF/YER057c/UK114 family)
MASRKCYGDPSTPYSVAVRTDGLVFVSGAVGVDSHGVAPEGIDAQTRLALESLARSCEIASCSLRACSRIR